MPLGSPQLQHDVRAPGVAVLLDRRDAVGGRARDRLALVEDRVGHLLLRREASAAFHRLGDRPDLLDVDPGELEQRVSGAFDVLHLVREVHPGDLARAVASLVAILCDRRHDRAADVDVRLHVVACVADERRRGDRRREAAVADLPGERLHLRRRRRDVHGRHAVRRIGVHRRHVGAPGVAVITERVTGEDATYDRHGVAHRPERLVRLHQRVVEEDLRRPEAENEPPGRELLHDARVHRDLDGMPRERRDDSPRDRQPLRRLRHQRRDDRRRARLHLVLPPPRIRLREPDRVETVLVEGARGREHLVDRLHRQLHHTDTERLGHRSDPKETAPDERAGPMARSSSPSRSR